MLCHRLHKNKPLESSVNESKQLPFFVYLSSLSVYFLQYRPLVIYIKSEVVNNTVAEVLAAALELEIMLHKKTKISKAPQHTYQYFSSFVPFSFPLVRYFLFVKKKFSQTMFATPDRIVFWRML